MNIEQKLEGNAMKIKLAGRLDTNTSPDLEKVISNMPADVNSLEIDMSELDYISSAGLRVLLAAHKKMAEKEGMTVSNANDIINEIFEVTGFTDILNIK